MLRVTCRCNTSPSLRVVLHSPFCGISSLGPPMLPLKMRQGRLHLGSACALTGEDAKQVTLEGPAVQQRETTVADRRMSGMHAGG